jgi:hypothetical protein
MFIRVFFTCAKVTKILTGYFKRDPDGEKCSGVQVFGCSGVPVGTLVHWYIGMLVDFRIWQRIGKICVRVFRLLHCFTGIFAHLHIWQRIGKICFPVGRFLINYQLSSGIFFYPQICSDDISDFRRYYFEVAVDQGVILTHRFIGI